MRLPVRELEVIADDDTAAQGIARLVELIRNGARRCRFFCQCRPSDVLQDFAADIHARCSGRWRWASNFRPCAPKAGTSLRLLKFTGGGSVDDYAICRSS
jgi:hypothetical protein